MNYGKADCHLSWQLVLCAIWRLHFDFWRSRFDLKIAFLFVDCIIIWRSRSDFWRLRLYFCRCCSYFSIQLSLSCNRPLTYDTNANVRRRRIARKRFEIDMAVQKRFGEGQRQQTRQMGRPRRNLSETVKMTRLYPFIGNLWSFKLQEFVEGLMKQ